MKKQYKLLVLVLSIVLLVGALAIFASADTTEVAQVGETKYTSLADAIAAATETDTVTLIADATLSASVEVYKNLTINLNNNTLKVDATQAFIMASASKVNVIGDGDVELAGTLVANTDKSMAFEFTMKGEDKGINVLHKGTGDGAKIVDTKAGTLNFENVEIVSTSTKESADKVFFFTYGDSVGVTLNFKNMSFYNDGTPAGQNALGFIRLDGDAKATINNCNIYCGGTPIHAASNASRDVNNVVVDVVDSHLEIVSKDNDQRSNLMWVGGGTDGDNTPALTIQFKNSFIGGQSYRGVHGNEPVNGVMKVHIIFDNSVMANNGANDSKGSNDNDTQFTRGATLTFKNNSAIVSANSVGIGNKGVINCEVGTRFSNLNATKSGYKWWNADGSAATGVQFVYDPAGNANRPILSTLDATAGMTFEGVAKWDFAGMDHVSGQKSMSPYGVYVNNVGNSNFKSDFGDFYQGQPKTGAVTKYTGQENTTFKYWIPEVVTVDGSAKTTKTVKLGEEFKFGSKECDPYFVFGDNNSYDNAFAPIVDDETKSYKRTYVFVVDFDIATDSEYGYPKMSIATTARQGSTNKTTGTYAYLQYDGTLTNGMLEDFNTEAAKLSTTEWNHITAVYYTDGPTGLGQVYLYVNGELLGWCNEAYKEGANYFQGFRLSAGNNSTNKAGTSFLIDNLLRRTYTSYIGEGEADGADKTPAAYLVNLPKNTTPLNRNVTVNGYPYATIEDAMAAASAAGTYAELKADVKVPQVIKTNGSILLNNYTLLLDPESYGAEIKYNAKDEAESFKFDESFNEFSRDFYWYNGEPENYTQMTDFEHYYTKTTVKLGHTPMPIDYVDYYNYENYTISYLLGWGLDTEAFEFHPLTKAESDMDAVYYIPIFGEPNAMTYYVKNAEGYVTAGINDSQFNSAYAALKGGETIVLLADVEVTTTPRFMNRNLDEVHAVTLDNDYTEEELATMKAAAQTIGFDLNGHKAKVYTDRSFVQVANNTVFNVYSSVAGGAIESRAGHMRASDTEYKLYGQRVFAIYNGGAESGTNALTVSNAHINVGQFGEIPGSNMTVSGGVLYEGITGDNSCSINVDGVVSYRAVLDSAAAIMTRAYFGSIIIKNSAIISPTGGFIIDMKGNDDYGYKTKVTDEEGAETEVLVEATPYVYFENCILLNAGDGKNVNNIVSDNSDSPEIALEYKNVVANGRFNPSNEAGTKVKVHAGVGGSNYAIGACNAPEGIVDARTSVQMKLADYVANTNVLKVPVPVVDPTTGNVTYNDYYIVTPGFESEIPEGALTVVLPMITTITTAVENTVDVSFVDKDGELIKLYNENGDQTNRNPIPYVKGTTVVYDPGFKAPVYELNAINLVANGEWATEGITEINEAIAITAKYDATPGLDELKANLSLYSEFYINLYVPATLEQYIASVTIGETAVAVDGKVTIDGVQYIKLGVAVHPEHSTHVFKFAFNLKEGEYEAALTTEISVADYAKEVLDGEFSVNEKVLMYEALNYASEAAKYFKGETDEKLVSLLNAYVAWDLANEENTYEYAISEIGLGDVFASATVNLKGAPEFIFVAKEGFEGKVTIVVGENSTTYNVTAENNEIVVTGIKASDFLTDVVVYVGDATEATGKYNLDTFAVYHIANAARVLDETATDEEKASVEESKKCVGVLVAFYDYVEAANDYASNMGETDTEESGRVDTDQTGDTPVVDETID